MAQLKDTIINGDLNISNNATVGGSTIISGNLTVTGSIVSESIQAAVAAADGTSLGTVKEGEGGNVSISKGIITVKDNCHNHTSLTEVTRIDGTTNTGDGNSHGGLMRVGSSGRLILFSGEGHDQYVASSDSAGQNTENLELWADSNVVIYSNCQDYKSSSDPRKTFTFGNDGTLTANTFNANSDRRLKENLSPYTNEKSILDLPIYKFDYINGNKNQIGCMAQDLQEICPEIVNEGGDGYLSIQESKIVYLLLQEVKKLRKEVDELKKQGGCQ